MGKGKETAKLADSAELRGLLAHCAATPDEEPRLVLADWLEEHGDFRGEFVRAALAFDRTPPYDVTRFQLGERLRALLESPALKEWLPASPAFKWGWRRGLLTLIADTEKLQDECTFGTVRNTRKLVGWLASDWIERVEFDGYTRSRPFWEDTFGLVRHTRELHFAEDDYGPDVLTRLREWPHLRGLSLIGLCQPWAELASLPHLRSLKLKPDGRMMHELPRARLSNLEVLSLEAEWNGDLPHWGKCFPKLRSLTLDHYNGYPDEQCERFAQCSGLRHLGFQQRYQPFTRVGLKAFENLKELRSLALGSLRGTIAGLAKLSKLEFLAAGTKAKLLRGLEGLTQLRWLTLGVSTWTRGLAEQVLRLPHLARLDLYPSAFEAGAIAVLAKAPALRILVVVTPEKQKPPEELVRLEQLRYLWVGHWGLANPDVRSLQTTMPACRIAQGWPSAAEDAYDWS
jgi:uncharacterized protein (TIGR02996 family)